MEDDVMKKVFTLFLLGLLLLSVAACRQNDSAGQSASSVSEGKSETATETGSEETSSSTTETTAEVDVNANEEAFVQTGKDIEKVTLTLSGATPSTIVVDLGDLVTLSTTSERLKPTQLYNEDLLVDQTINRGETVDVAIETNEEGVFYFTDKTTGEQLFRFMIAGTTFGGKEE